MKTLLPLKEILDQLAILVEMVFMCIVCSVEHFFPFAGV